ncbi:MAG: hypothetical protein QM788_14570 [Roseateles sp.]|uniref:hypothetical protein n=1 Tax=Roseateles sp. TaxID=1971397 RepID=UPI0039EB58DB
MWARALWSFLVAAGCAVSALPAEAGPRPLWRVCVPDLVAPPYLYNDPARPGIAERLVVDAGRQAGLDVELLRLPPRRCRTAIEGHETHAVLLSPAAEVQARYLFPSKDGAPDPAQRVATLNFVWIKRKDAPYAWDGTQLSGGGDPASLTVGTRVNVRLAAEQLRQLGVAVDDSALTTRQLLLKIAARRVDLGVAFQAEADHLMADPVAAPLVMLARPLSQVDLYLAVPRHTDDARRQQAEAWWAAIGRLRGRPAYRKP